MARGYPEPATREEEIPEILPEGLCIICKRRAAEPGGYKCAICAAALAGASSRA